MSWEENTWQVATHGHNEVPPAWMPATQVRAFILEDPVIVWLEHHGQQHGFQPDSSPYQFLDWIAKKAKQFQDKWTREMASGAVRVCQEAYEVRSAARVHETLGLMRQGTPVIAQPALWWAPEKIYGVPDLLVHTSWLKQHFPALFSGLDEDAVAPLLHESHNLGYYLVFDLKFTTKLDTSDKAKEFRSNEAQVRLYSYILGHLQGLMPKHGYLIARDRISNPLPVAIKSTLGQPLDSDLAGIRDQYLEIKLSGAQYVPWKDDIVVSNIKEKDERWGTAKKIIAQEKVPGRDPGLLYYVSPGSKAILSGLGYPNLDAILKPDPAEVPLERCKGLGPKRSRQIRAILQANRSGSPLIPPASLIPKRRAFEFFVDFEYFTNLNVDFDTQWPALEGYEMIFMIGVGWEEEGKWAFKRFIAEQEAHTQELQIFEQFLESLQSRTNGVPLDSSHTVLYHWSPAEDWQTKRACDRHQLPGHHALRKLPWLDLEKTVFLDGPCALPGAWDFGLKSVSRALGRINPEYDPGWPGDLDEGLQAMVMGWEVYKKLQPLESAEMNTLTQYLEADCKALWKIVKWLRSHQAG